MPVTPQPDADHRRFELLCDGLDEYDQLPEPTPAPAHGDEQPHEALDGQILAVLVSPY